MSWFARKPEPDARPEARYELGVSSNLFAEPLPEGIYYPDFTTLVDYRPPEFLACFEVVREKPWRECTILDIGCGEGTSTVALGRSGARVIGIEGRPEVVRRAEYLRDRLGLTNVEFRTGSVLDDALWERADAVFVSGLIHHLAEPFQLIELIGRHCAGLAYFCTHLAPRDEAERAASHFAGVLQQPGTRDFRGRALPGIAFIEGADAREKQAARRRHPRAGIGNLQSWWLAEESLVEAMKMAGFASQKRLYANATRLRYRYAFSRAAQLPALGTARLLHPALTMPTAEESVERALAADIAFLRSRNINPSVAGDPGPAAEITRMLEKAGIAASESPAHVVVASGTYEDLKRRLGELLVLRACRYGFASFSMARFGLAPDPVDPVTGDPLPRA